MTVTGRSPAISVIIPTRNRAAFLSAAARCVLTQTERDLELIVVDDGSSDDTLQVVDELRRDDPRVRSVRQAHGGLAREEAYAALRAGERRTARVAAAHAVRLWPADAKAWL